MGRKNNELGQRRRTRRDKAREHYERNGKFDGRATRHKMNLVTKSTVAAQSEAPLQKSTRPQKRR